MRHLTTIVMKERLTLLRSGKAFWNLILVLVVASGAFLMVWMSHGSQMQLAERTQLARSLFMTLSGFEIAAFGFLSIIMTTSAITLERENKTLDLLFCTRITRGGILLGKWATAVVYQFLVAVCLLPVMGLVFQLGGVGFDEYLFTAVIVISTILTYTMLGVAVSTLVQKSGKALALGLVLLVGICFGLFSSMFSVFGFFFGLGIPMLAVSPLYVWFLSLSQNIFYTGGGGVSGLDIFLQPYLLMHLGFQVCLFAISYGIAWKRLAWAESGKGHVIGKSITDKELLRRRRTHWPFYLIDPLRKAQAIGDTQNPVRIKERRVSTMAKPETAFRLAALGCLLSFSSLFMIFLGSGGVDGEDVATCCAVALGYALLLGPILTASAITREREEHTWDLLRTTLVSPAGILSGKMFAALRLYLALMGGVIILPLVCGLLFGKNRAEATGLFLLALPTLVAYAALFATIGLCVSTFAKRTITAVVGTYVALLVCLVSPLFFVLCEEVCDRVYMDMFKAWFEVLGQSVGAILCPFYYFSDEENVFGDWDDDLRRSIPLVLFHLMAVVCLTWALFVGAARRLRQVKD